MTWVSLTFKAIYKKYKHCIYAKARSYVPKLPAYGYKTFTYFKIYY